MSYAVLGLVFVAVAAVLATAVARLARLPRRWWSATLLVGVVLMVLTAVFDSVMITADLFRYDESALVGPRVWLTPVEDLAWPVFAVLALPALWELAGLAGSLRSRRAAGVVAGEARREH